MIDLHTHTFLSDGALIPSELVQRASQMGYRAIALTDHVDGSNIDRIVPKLIKVARELNRFQTIFVIPGVEITHAPIQQIPELVARARELGALNIVVHGETLTEPVPAGTNRAAIEAGVDILAHPGLISVEDAKLAASRGVALEITARGGHGITNGHVARVGKEAGASFVIDTDTHRPSDLVSREGAKKVLKGAGLLDHEVEAVLQNNERLVEKFKKLFQK